MKAIHSIIAALGVAFVLPAPANAAQTDPEVILYRFPWVRDNGGNAEGIATVFSCTNFSGATETIRFVTRRFDTTLVGNTTVTIMHLGTIAVVTHPPLAIGFNASLNTGVVDPATTAIAATSTNIICTATVVDAANGAANGVALRGVRFSPVPGSQE